MVFPTLRTVACSHLHSLRSHLHSSYAALITCPGAGPQWRRLIMLATRRQGRAIHERPSCRALPSWRALARRIIRRRRPRPPLLGDPLAWCSRRAALVCVLCVTHSASSSRPSHSSSNSRAAARAGSKHWRGLAAWLLTHKGHASYRATAGQALLARAGQQTQPHQGQKEASPAKRR